MFLSQAQDNEMHLQTRFKPKVVARRKADPDEAAAEQASTSGAPENDAFKDLIIAVNTLPSQGRVLFALFACRL